MSGKKATGRGGQCPEERFVVERVGDHRQQGAQVLDLLLGPEAAAADDVWVEPRVVERRLEGGDVGERA